MNNEFLSFARTGAYQKENFDEFLKNISFNFNLPAVHITGTNGKGSVTNYLNNIFINEGYKVGVFSSPFLYDVNELILVNNEKISDEKFLEIFKRYKDDFIRYNLSEFEIETFVALTYFKEVNCDICFIECGMGGRSDATNIFSPILSIITSVGLEHTSFLGKTYAEIAYSKGGIIKDYVPVVIGNLNPEAEKVITDICIEHESKLHKVYDPSFLETNEIGIKFSYGEFSNIQLKDFAFYQVNNACIVLEAITILREKFHIKLESIISSFLVVYLDARFTVLGDKNNVIVDGAHNPQAIDALRESIERFSKEKPIHILFCCFKDKNLSSMISSLGQLTNDITFTTFNHVRARSQDEYFIFLGDYKYENDPIKAYDSLLENYPDDIILITGSLAFAAYMLREIKR